MSKPGKKAKRELDPIIGHSIVSRAIRLSVPDFLDNPDNEVAGELLADAVFELRCTEQELRDALYPELRAVCPEYRLAKMMELQTLAYRFTFTDACRYPQTFVEVIDKRSWKEFGTLLYYAAHPSQIDHDLDNAREFLRKVETAIACARGEGV